MQLTILSVRNANRVVLKKALAASTAAAKVSYLPADPSTISYGAISANLPGHTDNTFYLSTAIAYTNGLPHVGHAYEVNRYKTKYIL